MQSQLYLSADSVGQAKILAGATSVRVTFSRAYEQQPIVTLTANSRVGGEYWVADKDATGFTVFIDRSYMSNSSYPSNELNSDITFDWHAFASPEAKLFVSNGTTENITLVLAPAPLVTPPPADSTIAPQDSSSEDGQAQLQEDAQDTPPGEVAGDSVEETPEEPTSTQAPSVGEQETISVTDSNQSLSLQ